MKHPTDKDGKLLKSGGFYAGYNSGIYQLIDFEICKHENISIVKKVVSGRGVAVNNPRPKYMDNDWLRALPVPTIVQDHGGYWNRKQKRIKNNELTSGKRLIEEHQQGKNEEMSAAN